MSEKKIEVRMGNFIVSSSIVLESIGLGSCIAICLYDKKNKIGEE